MHYREDELVSGRRPIGTVCEREKPTSTFPLSCDAVPAPDKALRGVGGAALLRWQMLLSYYPASQMKRSENRNPVTGRHVSGEIFRKRSE